MFNDLAGQNLDRYRLVRLITEDHLGAVYRAYDTSLQRDVAVRVINPTISRQPTFADSFARAARTAARLDHPNLIQVYDFGEARSLYYIVTEFLPGDNLQQILADLERGGRWIPLSQAVQIVLQLSLALEYIRSQGASQRLAEPGNIQIKGVQSERLPYQPILTDLDLDRLAHESLGEEPGVQASAQTESPDPAYYSPERVLGRSTDARSDVYSLGVLLFELCTGQLPFPIENLEDAVRYHPRQPLPPPRIMRPDLPEAFEQIIIKALEKTPEARFPNPASLAAELDKIYPSLVGIDTAPPAFESVVSLLVPYRESLAEPPEEASILPSAMPVDADATQVSASATAPEPAPEGGRLEVFLDNAQLSVEPGSSASTILTVRSVGNMQGRFRIMLEGLPAIWVSLSPQMVELEPGQSKQVRLLIRPSRSSHSRAGRYPFVVQAVNLYAQGGMARVGATLTVAAFERFSSELLKSRLASGEDGRVAVNNQGNTPATFTINFWNPDNDLVFRPRQAQIRLNEGQVGATEFRAEPRQSHWFGRERVYPFSVQVASAGGERQDHSGGITSFPLIPTWLVALTLVVFVCLAGSVLLFLGRSSLQASRATGTAIAAQTLIAGTPLAQTATAEFVAGANQATVQAAISTLAAATAQTATAQSATAAAAQAQTATAQIGATQTRAVEQVTQIASQTAAAETVTALQATRAAEALAATQTAQVQQATLVAGYLAATQTAAVVQATQIAATAQAAAAATAQAAAATAQAATATSLAATATALAVPSQTPGPVRNLAYVYLTDAGEAKDYQTLLQAHGFKVDLLPEDALPITNFKNYLAVLVGPQTGSGNIWGDPGGSQFNALFNSGLPILGIGEGGYAFFGKAALSIGWNHGATGSGKELQVVDPANLLWSEPSQIPIPVDRLLEIYTNNSSFVAINIPAPVQDVSTLGRNPSDANQYMLVRQQDKYILWGFANGPKNMTPTGQQLFVNVVESLLR